MSLLRTALLLGLALQTCGPRSVASDEPDPPITVTPDRHHDPAGNTASACPDRFDYAMHGTTCERGSVCSYPGAACECRARAPCTGVDPGDAAELVWNCTAQAPSYPRGDGCPIQVPVRGHACTSAAEVCVYSPYCGGIQSTARCRSGVWTIDEVELSAPPSTEG